MNIGQILETHLGWAASRLGFRSITPVFDGASETEIEAELARAWLMDRAWTDVTEWAYDWLKENDVNLQLIADDDEARRMFISTWLGDDPDLIGQSLMSCTYARRY